MCAVEGCGRQPEHLIRLDHPSVDAPGATEAGVCDEHFAEVERGAPWVQLGPMPEIMLGAENVARLQLFVPESMNVKFMSRTGEVEPLRRLIFTGRFYGETDSAPERTVDVLLHRGFLEHMGRMAGMVPRDVDPSSD